MRHPFDGINEPAGSTRRGILGMFAAVAGYFGFTSLANAAAPPSNRVGIAPPSPEPTTERVGEEGGKVTKALIPSETGGKPPVVTGAVGEDGGPRITTLAVGEEGGATKALREAGGPIMSTKALGEEGGVKPPVKIGPPVATTLAVGEEGAKKE